MATTTLDPSLAALAADIESRYQQPENDPWESSPFAFLRRLPSRARGAAGEAFVEQWARSIGIDVARPTSSQHDRVLAGHKVEIKMSTLWANGTYRFQQVRDQDYDHMLCLGISPQRVHAWLVPKAVLREHVIGILGQHTGAAGADTAWFGFTPENAPAWLAPYGATLEDVAALLTA